MTSVATKRPSGAGAAGQDDGEPAAVAAAARELYSTELERFSDLRSELVARARENGEPEAAKSIAKLRKPTTAAWIVNRHVRDDETAVERLLELNDRLRDAQENLDADLLRNLSAERRKLVDELTRRALGSAGRRDAAAQLRDEVRSTFDAAAADPSIALRLGRLQRSESWSGFGVAPATGPELTVLKGGRARQPDAPRRVASGKRTRVDKPAKPSKALVAARNALSEAESAAESAADEERSCTKRVDSLNAKLSELEAELNGARKSLEKARTAAKAARARRREAQTALNRAERTSKAQQ